jgi:hypothetical protein
MKANEGSSLWRVTVLNLAMIVTKTIFNKCLF